MIRIPVKTVHSQVLVQPLQPVVPVRSLALRLRIGKPDIVRSCHGLVIFPAFPIVPGAGGGIGDGHHQIHGILRNLDDAEIAAAHGNRTRLESSQAAVDKNAVFRGYQVVFLVNRARAAEVISGKAHQHISVQIQAAGIRYPLHARDGQQRIFRLFHRKNVTVKIQVGRVGN